MSIKNTTKRKLLAGVGTTVLATLLAGAAQSAEITINNVGVGQALGHKVQNDVQELVNPSALGETAVNASIANGHISIDTENGTSFNTKQADSNLIGASATGNTFSNVIELETALDDDADNEGAVALGIAQVHNVAGNAGTATVSSSVGGSGIEITDTDFGGDSWSASGNTITAQTNVNSGTSDLLGKLPGAFASDTAGQSSLNFPDGDATLGNLVSSTGGLVIGSVQQNEVSGHNATSFGNYVRLDLDSTDDYELSGSPALDGNAIEARLNGNKATSNIGIDGGDNSDFTGSAALSNLQINSAVGADTAENTGSNITATISGDAADALYELKGGLSVQGNSIASSITGNRATGTTDSTGTTAGNRIALGDGMAFVGSDADPVSAGTVTTYTNGGVDTAVTADLLVNNSQGNQGLNGANQQAFNATTTNGHVTSDVQSIDSGSISQTSNSVTASGTGNVATSSLSTGANTPSFVGTAAIANQQTNNHAAVTASNTGGAVTATTGNDGGVTHGSTVDVSENTVSASGTGNSAQQLLALDATQLTIGDGPATLTGGIGGTENDGNVTATGAATISNLQSAYNGDVTVSNSGSNITVNATSTGDGTDGETIVGSTLKSTNNNQTASAQGNSGNSTLNLSGTAVGTGGGISSVQIANDDTAISASLTGATSGVNAGTDVSGTSLSATDGDQTALAKVSSAVNAVNVEATNIATAPTTGAASQVGYEIHGADPEFDYSSQPQVSAGYAVLNDQNSDASAAALANGHNGISVDGDMLDTSSATTAGNRLIAQAGGNDASSTVTIGGANDSRTNLTTGPLGGYASVANVTNTQADSGDTTALATGGSVISTDIDGALSNSSVRNGGKVENGLMAGGNVISALATANNASNNVDVSANALDIADDEVATGVHATGTVGDSNLSATASFSVLNAQSSDGLVSARQIAEGGPANTAARIAVTVDGAITGSQVDASGNRSFANATGNSATNGVGIDATEIATSSGVANFQSTSSQIEAAAGGKGTTPIPSVTFNVDATPNITGTYDSETDTYFDIAGYWEIDKTALTGDQINYLVNSGEWTDEGSTLQHAYDGPTSGLGPVAYVNYTTQPMAAGGTFGGTPGNPNYGGVTITAGANVTDSSLSVTANSATIGTVGNVANNTVAVSGNSIEPGSSNDSGSALYSGAGLTADADHSLLNVQSVTSGASLESSGAGSFAVDLADGSEVSGSTLTVSGNSQSVTATANDATDTLALTGTGISANSALASHQTNAASIDLSSDLDALVAGFDAESSSSVVNSTLAVSGNTNEGTATGNTATNTLGVSGTNISSGVTTLANAGTAVAGTGADASHALASGQVFSGDEDQSIAVDVNGSYSVGLAEDATVSGSTLGVTGNNQSATGVANTVANTLNLAGTEVAASSALSSSQENGADITVASTFNAFLSGADTVSASALSSSSLAVSDNVNTGYGQGNVATNTLKVAGSSTLDVGDTTSTAGNTLLGVLATATHALTNDQVNDGGVDTTVNGTYNVGVSDGASVTGSSIEASRNIQTGVAVANVGKNTLDVSGSASLTAGSALASSQSGIDADVAAESSMSVFAPAAVATSSVDMSGNVNTALGVINDVTNVASISGSNIGTPAAAPANVSLTGGTTGWSASADQALFNTQSASGTVSGTAASNIFNQEGGSAGDAGGVGGMLNASLSITGNKTNAEASANRASNTLNVNSATSLSATSGLVNRQDSSATATASATTTARTTLNADAATALDSSSVALTGNSTQALARGNTATNVLNAVASTSYGASAGGAGVTFDGTALTESVAASAGLLNSQSNSGDVSASSTNAVYRVALNADTGAVTNGSVSVGGNSVGAIAYGNSATNSVTLAGLPTGTSTAALGSHQVNSGAITASVTGASLGITAGVGVGSSSLGVSGNTISANAVGNSASNVIGRK
ncbi:MAG: hypothetical protein WBA15_03500 [Mesorhizobium sp.]